MISPQQLLKNHPLFSLIAVLISMSAVTGVIYGGTHFYCAYRYDSQFPQVKVGQSKKAVIEKLGEPAEITDCNYYRHSGISETAAEKCLEIYLYGALLKEYIIVFDKKQKVLDRWSIISG